MDDNKSLFLGSENDQNTTTSLLSSQDKREEKEQRKDRQKERESRARDSVPFFSVENFKYLFFWALVVVCLRSSVVAPYVVPTASMEPTIKVGDRILANKLAYGLRVPVFGHKVLDWGQVRRGDIIVFSYPKDPDIEFVKRVVAVQGDSVQVIGGLLYINGGPIERISHEYDRSILSDIGDNAEVKHLYVESLEDHTFFVTEDSKGMMSLRNRNWPMGGRAYVVPDNAVFVMGDNRDNSHDSRKWHHVPLSLVQGKAMWVLWSVRPSESWLPHFRSQRFLYSLYQHIVAPIQQNL